MNELDTLRSDMLAVLERPSDELYCQPHPELSPLAWHVGHAIQVEHYWLCEQVLGQTADARAHAIYFPEYTTKAARAEQLPALDALRESLHARAGACAAAWHQVPPRHGAISSGYLHAFISQHYAQHLETVAMADHALRIEESKAVRSLSLADAVSHTATQWVGIPDTELRVGALENCCTPAPYDNELGAHMASIPAQRIARSPITNAQWLGFVAAGGYGQSALWTTAGWEWRGRNKVNAPWGWRLEGDDVHVCSAWAGAAQLNAPVVGISKHEADAYACWAGAELPHEHAWMAAQQAGVLADSGQVWEWCGNPLDTWPGFVAFPYTRYTLPWCDGQHWVLKGGSAATRAAIRRPSFRNFYTAGQRHIFAGLRLCLPG